jgi:AraC-like DNA-binding protein
MLPLRITAPESYPGRESTGVEPSVPWLRAVGAGRAKQIGASLAASLGNQGPGSSDAAPTDTLRRLAEACRYSSRELARFLGISQRQLQRVFRSRLGCTPQAFLREERLQAAERLLHSASSVKEVAYSLGFCQQSQFSRDFKKRFSRRPSALQRAGRSKSGPAPAAAQSPMTERELDSGPASSRRPSGHGERQDRDHGSR